MRRRTLPLSALRAFEAAARHLSFKAAAEELAVTPAAISFQIKSLEALVDVDLFVRKPRRVELTNAGKSLFASVESALDEIATAIDRLAARPQLKTVTLGANALLAERWLCPRLAKFWQAHPEVGMRVNHNSTTVDLRAQSVDMCILWGEGNWPDLEQEILLSASITPVCSPELMQYQGLLECPTQLAHAPLIHCGSFEDWEQWLRAAGSKGVDTASGIVTDDPTEALQSAIDGRGIAMGHVLLVEEDIKAGRLIQPFDLTVAASQAFHLVYAKSALTRPELRMAFDWLIAESRNDQAIAAQ